MIIESDNASVIDFCVSNFKDPPWEVKAVIDDVQPFSHRANLSFNFVNRDANKAAHSLANFARSGGNMPSASVLFSAACLDV